MVPCAIRWFFVLASALALGCDESTPAPPADTAASGSSAIVSVAETAGSGPGIGVSATNTAPSDPGDIALAQLQRWYDSTVRDCGGPALPAFLCSGVLLRGVATSAAFLPWDPSPDGIAKGGISASWIRTDDNFSARVYSNGLIFYPPSEAPVGTTPMEVLCSFPMDADSWNRRTLQGCGPHPLFPVYSAPCQDQGIHTAEQWIANLNQHPGLQCGWNVRLDTPDRARHFYESIRARSLLTDPNYWNVYNELVVKTWASGIGGTLSLHSLFYMSGNATGLANARYDQKRYYDLYGKFLPIVALALPASKDGVASFSFAWSEQNLGLAPVGSLAPRVMEASGENGQLLRIGDFYRSNTVTVRVPQYVGMTAGQQVGVRWSGSVVYTSSRTVTTVGAMDFSVPRMDVVDAIGTMVPVTFFVKREGGQEEVSASLDLAIEAQPFDLPAPTIDATASKVSFTFAGIQPGFHNVSMRWAGIAMRDTPRQAVTHGGEQTIDVPFAWVDENRGRTVSMNIAVGDAKGSRYMFSRVLRFQVPGEDIDNLRPQVLEASGSNGRLLRIDDFYRRDYVTARVPEYPGMAVGQNVGIRWAGSVMYTDTKSVTMIGPMDFSVPRVEVVDNIGRTVPVTFFVMREEGAEQISASLDLAIEAQPLDLPAPTIDASHSTVSFAFAGMRPGFHRLSMRWAGVVVRDTPAALVSHDGEQTFVVPAAWVAENKGRTVFINIAVGDAAGNRFMFSRVLRLPL